MEEVGFLRAKFLRLLFSFLRFLLGFLFPEGRVSCELNGPEDASEQDGSCEDVLDLHGCLSSPVVDVEGVEREHGEKDGDEDDAGDEWRPLFLLFDDGRMLGHEFCLSCACKSSAAFDSAQRRRVSLKVDVESRLPQAERGDVRGRLRRDVSAVVRRSRSGDAEGGVSGEPGTASDGTVPHG